MRLHLRSLVVLAAVVVALGGAAIWVHHLGLRAYVVHTGSMSPTLPPGDLVIDRPGTTPYAVGDVITFRHGQGADVVTHRLVAITPQGLHTKGDANASADVWTIRPDQVEGVYAQRVPGAGYVVVFFQQPAGIAAVMCAGLALLSLWSLFFGPTDPAPPRQRAARRRSSATSGATAVTA